MKRKWENTQVQIYSTTIPTEDYNLLLDAWAEVVYGHICQLSQDQIKVPVTHKPYVAESAGA